VVDAMLQEPPRALQKLAQIQSPLAVAARGQQTEAQLLALEYRHREAAKAQEHTQATRAAAAVIMPILRQEA